MSEGVKLFKLDDECGVDNCRSKRYYFDNALLYCSEGHQHVRPRLKQSQQTQDDEADFGTQGQKTRQTKETWGKASRIYHGQKALELYLQAYQLILWKQCYTLIHILGLPAEMEVVVQDIWSLRLREVDAGFEEAVFHSSQETSKPDTGSQGEREGKERLSRSRNIPALIDSLGTCYLGMILLRLPISIGDLHRWAYKEDIPYIRAIRFVPATMREKLPARYLAALDTQSILQPDDLRKTIHELALFYSHHFEIIFPPLNYPLLLFKYIRDLALPLEIFPAVRRMAELVDIDFTFPQSKIRQRLSFSPEMALIALLVIAVKIYHPFDAIDRHPRSLNDPGTLATDWDRWCKLQKDYDSRDTARGKLGRGNEIKITESDSFNLSGDQVDEYLDWFEKTFVDEKRARKHPRGYPEQLLEMFPTGKPAGSINTSVDPELERQKDEEALQHKLRTVQGILKMRQVISDDDADLTREPVNRLGSYYERYRKMEDLSCTAKVFHETAANLVSIKLHSLMVAVMQIEHKLLGWQRRQREAALESDSDGMRSQQASEDFPPDFEAVSASDSASMDEDFAMRVHAGDQ